MIPKRPRRFARYRRSLKDKDGNVSGVLSSALDITDRKQAVDLLLASEERYRGLFEDSRLALWEEDFSEVKLIIEEVRKQGVTDFREYFNHHPEQVTRCIDQIKVVDVNQTALKLIGAKNKAKIPGNLRILIPDEAHEDFQEELINIAEGKTAFQWQGINTTLSGKRQVINVNWSVVLGHEETLDKVLLSIMDVSDQKEAEEQIRILSKFPGENPNPVIRISPEGILLYANPASKPLVTMWNIQTGQAMPEEWQGWVGEVFSTGKNKELEIHCGELIFSCMLAPVVDAGYVNVYGRDTTDRKLMESKLDEERILLRTLIDNLPDRIYVMDGEGRKIISNTADWRAAGGKTMEDVIGKTDLETYPPEMAKDYWSLDKAVMESGMPVINREEQGLDALGNYVTVLSSKVPLRDNQGKVVGLVGVGRDVTEQKSIENKIEILSRIPDESPNPILRVTKQGLVLYANKTSAPLLTFWKTETGQRLPDEWRDKVRNVFDLGLYQEFEAAVDDKVYSLIFAPILDAGYINLYGRDITERKRAEEALAHQNEEIQKRNVELDRLYQATGSLLASTPFDLKGLATSIVDTVLKEFGHANCSLIVVRKDSKELVRLATGGLYTEQVKDKKLTRDGTGLVPQVLSSGTLMNVSDIHTIPGFVPNWDEAQSELTIPLNVENEVIGVIDIQSPVKGAFGPGDERVMSIFAERAALALEHGRLNEELENHVRRLTALRSIDAAISSSMDINLTLDILLEKAIQLLGIDSADVLIFNPITQTFRYSIGRGFRTQALQYTDLRLGDGYAGQAALSRQVVTVPDLPRHTGGLQRSSDFRREGFISYIGAPLIAKGQIKGVLEVFKRETFSLDKDRYAFLEMLAGQAAIAIDSSQLFENLQGSNSELMMAYDETIEGWSRAMDLRDEETEGHSRRVTEMTLRLASSLNAKPEELLHIRRGALLHDIGKIGIPDDILRKPGALTDEEWVIMRRHPQIAYDMLKPILYLGSAVDIPWCHHERWDGTGYPQGLKGEQIPLAARIFAVVDVWDALLSDRPYRKAWTEDKVRKHIQEQSGKHFDPQIVEGFLKQVSTKE